MPRRSSAIAILVLILLPAKALAADREVLLQLAGMCAHDPAARVAALRSAGTTHRALFVGPIRGLLEARDPKVRAAAAEALGELGVPRTTGDLYDLISALQLATRDSDDSVARAAIAALARYPFPEVRVFLVGSESDPKTSVTRKKAIALALKTPALDSKQRLEAWLEVSAREARAVAIAPADRFGVAADPLLLSARDLIDPDPSLHASAAERIARSSDPDELRLPFLVRALEERDPAIRRVAAKAIADKDLDTFMVALVPALRDVDRAVRELALSGIARRPLSKTTKALVERLGDETDPELRSMIIAALEQHVEAQVLADIGAWSGKESETARVGAIEVLSTFTATRSTELLVSMMAAAKREETADEARAVIDRRSDSQVVPALLAVLVHAPKSTRNRILAVLAKRSDDRIRASLSSLAEKGDADRALFVALQVQPGARTSLLHLLSNEREPVRGRALEHIAEYRGQDVVDGLARALDAHPRDARLLQLLLLQDRSLLLEPLLRLLASPEERAYRREILEALRGQRDPRVAQAVTLAAEDSPELAPLAIEIVRDQSESAAVPALEHLSSDQHLRANDRADALRSMAGYGSERVMELVRPLALDEQLEVRMAARNALHSLDPEVYPKWDPYGRIPLVVESAGFGAAMMLIASDIADTKLSPAFTGGAGLVLGAATPFLLTLNEDVTLGDAAYFGTAGLWGTLGGWGAGGALRLSDQNVRWATLGGEVLGLAAGGLLMRRAEWAVEDAALVDFGAIEAGLVTASIASLATSGSSADVGYAAMVGGAIAAVPLSLFAKKLEVDQHWLAVSTWMAHSAWIGMMAAGMVDPSGLDSNRALAGLAAGQGVGFLSALVLDRFGDPSPREAWMSGLGAVAGASMLGGLALAFDADSRPVYALAEAGSVAGALTLGLLAERIDFHHNDEIILLLSAMGGTIAGGQFSVRLKEGTFGDRSFPGGLLFGFGAGSMGGLLLSQLVDVSDRELSQTLLGGGLFGAAGTGLGFMLPNLDVRTQSNITGLSIVGGLALTYPFSERIRLSEDNVAYGAITGSLLGLWTGLTPAYWNAGNTLPLDQIGGGLLLGSTLGAAGGMAIAQGLSLDGGRLGVIALGGTAGSAMGAGLGLVVPSMPDWAAVALMQGVGLSSLTAFTVLTQSARGALYADEARDRDLARHATLFGMYGALHGALIPAVWRTGDLPAREVGGGALLGVGAGSLAGVLTLSLLDHPLELPDLLETGAYAAAAHGAGLGIGLIAGDGRIGASLMEGLGAGALAAGIALAPHTQYRIDDGITFVSGMSALGWIGGWLPFVLYGPNPPSASQIQGGVILGASLGVAGSALYTQLTPERHELEVLTMTAGAAGLGAGLGLLVPSASDRAAISLMEGASVLGLSSGIFFSPHTRYDSGDLGLIALASTLGAWHGAWFSRAASWGDSTDRQTGGGALFGSSFGLLSALAIAQIADPSMADIGKISLLSLAANAAGGGLSLSLSGSAHDDALAIELSGLGGLALASVLAPRIELASSDATLVLLTSIAGAGAGALFPRMTTDSPADAQLAGGALLGAGVGTIAGTLLSQVGSFSYDDQIESTLFGVAGTGIGAGITLLGSSTTDRASAYLIDGAGLGFLAAGLALSHFTDYSADDRYLIGFGTAVGLWNGLWLPALLVDPKDPITDRARAGGALLGASVGAVAAGVLSQAVDLDTDQQIKAGVPWLFASALGAGAGLIAPSLDRRATVALMEGTGAVGLASGLLLSNHMQYSSGDLALVPVGALLGTGLGLTMPTLLGDDNGAGGKDGDALRAGGALLGAGLFGLSTVVLSQATEYSGGEVFMIGASSAIAGAMGLGFGLAIPDSSTRLQLGLMDGVGLLGAIAALTYAPHVQLKKDDALTMLLTGSIGTTLGALMPALWNGSSIDSTPGQQAGGGAMVGAGLGLGAGLLLSQAVDLEGKNREYGALGASIGALSGTGIGLLASKDDRVAIGLLEGLTLAGSLGLAMTGPDMKYTAGDLALGSAYVGYLLWHAEGLTLLLEGTDRQAAGAAMATVGLGTVTGMYLAPYIHLSMAKVLMLFAGNVWGTWIGGWGGAVIRDEIGKDLASRRSAGLTLVSSVLGSDVGLGITGLVVSGLLDVKPTRFAVINLSGLGGMMLGMLVAGFAKGDPLKTGNIVGSLSGLAIGTLVTGLINLDAGPSWDELLSNRAEAKPAEVAERAPVSNGPRGVVGIDSWFPSARVAQSPEGVGQYLFTIMGTWH
jgi:HEAT repeat protein